MGALAKAGAENCNSLKTWNSSHNSSPSAVQKNIAKLQG